MKLIAQRGSSYLFDLGDEQGRVLELPENRDPVLSPPMSLQSILARGYWTGIKDRADIAAATAERLATSPQEQKSVNVSGYERIVRGRPEHVHPYSRSGNAAHDVGGVAEKLAADDPILRLQPAIAPEATGRRLDEILKTWHGFKFGRLATRLDSVDEYGNVKLSIFDTEGDPTRPVGSIERFFDHDGAERYVEHASFFLNDGYQGAGFGAAFFKASEDMYKRLDIGYIDVGASNVGGYAWARMGFEFHDAREMYEIMHGNHQRLSSLDALVAEGKISRRQAAQFEARVYPSLRGAELDEIPDGYFRSEADIAAFGAEASWMEDGREMWLGKWVMLDSSWSGRKRLKPHRRAKGIDLGSLAAHYDSWVAEKIRDGGPTMSAYGDGGNVWFDDDRSFWQDSDP